MNKLLTNNETSSSDEISLKEIVQKFVIWWSYLKTKLILLLIVSLISGCIGFFYALIQPITYTSKMVFVVEEGKSGSSGLGNLASLAGQFGVDVGGSSGGGVLSGDNILLYFKSESLAREVLLSSYDSTTNQTLADVYSEIYKLKSSWEKNKNIGRINFPVFNDSIKYSRLQDSLLHQIIESILNSKFSVSKVDKKSGFIEVNTTMENEKLSKIYCERIVKIAVSRYINIKTQRQKITVDKLQMRVDSIASLLRQKTISSADLQKSASTMDINPLYRTGNAVAVETTVRDKAMLATIFASAVQNLELAKFTLSQETPVIQVIDMSNYPLQKNKVSKVVKSIQASLLFTFLFTIFIILKRIYNLSIS